jgi:hypothetical protein
VHKALQGRGKVAQTLLPARPQDSTQRAILAGFEVSQ